MQVPTRLAIFPSYVSMKTWVRGDVFVREIQFDLCTASSRNHKIEALTPPRMAPSVQHGV